MKTRERIDLMELVARMDRLARLHNRPPTTGELGYSRSVLRKLEHRHHIKKVYREECGQRLCCWKIPWWRPRNFFIWFWVKLMRKLGITKG